VNTRVVGVLAGLALARTTSAQPVSADPPWGAPPPVRAPAPPVYEERAPVAAQPAVSRRNPETLFRASVGLGYRRLFVATILGADFNVSVGTLLRGELSLLFGETLSGRRALYPRLGFSVQVPWGRFRLGGGLQFMFVDVERVTYDGSLSGFAMSLFLLAQVDVVRWDRYSLFVGVRGGTDYVSAFHGMASLEVGFGL